MAINWNKYKTYDTSSGYGSASEWKNSFYERMNSDEAARIISEQSETPWQVLGVSRDASQAEIKKAFRKLISEWHPDRNPSPDADAMSKKIIAAYTILTK